ncbi:MAG: STAS/SEC14 domain-containing protein [Planctomycetota bacterium]
MGVSVSADIDGKAVAVTVRGKLDVEDYEQFVPVLEKQIARYGRINFLVELADFQGWSAGAFWKDCKFGAKHFRDVERLAVVGEGAWAEGMAFFAKPFTTAEVRHFPPDRKDEAMRWIREEEEAE